MTLSEIHRTFPTDDSCLEYIVQMRWPNGVLCVYCQGKNVARIVRKKASRNKRAWVFQCNDCMKLAQATDSCEPYQFSATSGSIFHDSKVPLHKWFLAISLMLDAKKGFSANQLKRALGTQYRTAWHMFHRIREAMQEGFVASGKVEVDETYLDGHKVVIFGVKERNGRLKLIHTKDAKRTTAEEVFKQHIDKDVTLYTDGAAIYDHIIPFKVRRQKHKRINHSLEYVRGDVHIGGVESSFSLFKRSLIGTYHQLSTKHLQRYLTEFSYKHNHRNDGDMFSNTLAKMTSTSPLTYEALIADTEGEKW